MKLWPVLGVTGPRQVGKSTLLRTQLLPLTGGDYLTLDLRENRERAMKSPDYFIQTHLPDKQGPLILDEVQKVPDLFDAIKAEVDVNRRPGRFLLSGSAEFSKKTGIRESLTGRIGMTHLYPFTTSELNERPLYAPWVAFKPKESHSTIQEIHLCLERGGMPGICFLRSEEERSAAFEGWLDTTCYRDLQQIQGSHLSGDLAKEILQILAVLEIPSAFEAAKKLKLDVRRIKKHLDALEALFLVHRLEPHRSGIGKPYYYIFDAGLAAHLGASLKTRLRIWTLNECLAQHEYKNKIRPKIRHYESSKHSKIDFVIEKKESCTAVLIDDESSPSKYTIRALEAFQKKSPNANAMLLAPVQTVHRLGAQCLLVPWTAMG